MYIYLVYNNEFDPITKKVIRAERRAKTYIKKISSKFGIEFTEDEEQAFCSDSDHYPKGFVDAVFLFTGIFVRPIHK